MPIYEYHCEDCDNSFETLIRLGHQEDAECPACHGGGLNREMSVFAAHGGSTEAVSAADGGPMRGGGGCCGGSCGCG
jgi:putative FmdB family regulatory protein